MGDRRPGGTTRPRLPRQLARGGAELSASQGQQLFLAGKEEGNEWVPVNQHSLPGTLNEGELVAPLSHREGHVGRMFFQHAFTNPLPTLH